MPESRRAAEPVPETSAQELLSTLALTSFELNGRFLGIANDMASAAGLTAARWQVLGAVLQAPLTVAGIARAMGMTRQGVQRVADDVVAAGLAEYRDNPAHKRARLVTPTAAGYAAVRRISPGHARVADALVDDLGADRLEQIVTALRDLSAAVDRLGPVARRERASMVHMEESS